MSLTVVLDVSAGFGIINTPHTHKDLIRLLTASETILAPDLYCSEACNVAWKYHTYGKVDLATANEKLSKSIDLIDVFFPVLSMHTDVLKLASSVSVSAYDATYLYLALVNNAKLLTLDKKLYSAYQKLQKDTT
jgi:predicted nucleic acid-binding protein